MCAQPCGFMVPDPGEIHVYIDRVNVGGSSKRT